MDGPYLELIGSNDFVLLASSLGSEQLGLVYLADNESVLTERLPHPSLSERSGPIHRLVSQNLIPTAGVIPEDVHIDLVMQDTGLFAVNLDLVGEGLVSTLSLTLIGEDAPSLEVDFSDLGIGGDGVSETILSLLQSEAAEAEELRILSTLVLSLTVFRLPACSHFHHVR